MNIQIEEVAWRRGKKTILRPLERNDIPQLRQWVNDPDVSQWLKRTRPFSEKTEEEWFDRISAQREDDLTIGVCAENGTLIGTMGLHRINLVHRNAITGAMIGSKDHQGKGYGTDAKMQLLAYAFLELGLHKVRSLVIAGNDRSVAYSKRCGYEEEGRLHQQIYRGGLWQDEILLAVFREKWVPLWEKYNTK